ncbi:MAG: hypothetical protein E7182_01725 [Erysipelotrichaceae bacterium]|nr:hypothetical protein [Erysipelotrichaceae bacterium]
MKLSKFLVLSAGLLGMTFAAGCSKVAAPIEEPEPVVEVEPEPTPEVQRKDIKISPDKTVSDYIKNMEFDTEKVWQYDLNGGSKYEPSKSGKMEDGRLVITKKDVKSAKSGTASLHSLNLSNLLYPGQILKANSKLVEGVPTAITDLDRGKGTYELILPGLTDNTFSIEETISSSYRSKLNTKLAEWKTLGKKLTANQSFSITQAFNSSQLAVDLGFGIGEKLKIDAKYEQGGETNIFVVAFEQIFFTVNVVLEGKKSTVIFDEEVTLEDVQREISPNEPPLLISTANYGQTIYLKVETSMDKSQLDAGFSYAGKVDLESKAKFTKTLENCKVNCLVYGGVADDFQNLTPIEGEDAADKINDLLLKGQTPLAEQVENAIMLSYGTSWLKNSDFARIQATTEYIDTSYEVLTGSTFKMENKGVFTIKEWWVKACPVDGFDEDGNPTFGKEELLYRDTTLFTGNERSVAIPANYGRVKFAYDVSCGSDWPLGDGTKGGEQGRRVWRTDFFKQGSVKITGTTFNSAAEFNIDGNIYKI